MFMIFFWVMLLLICISLVRKGRSNEKETAEEILKKRYARGEISQEEFARMKKEIRA
jgi:putative membrane protein